MPYFSRNVMDPFEARRVSLDMRTRRALNAKSLTPLCGAGRTEEQRTKRIEYAKAKRKHLLVLTCLGTGKG